MFPPIIFSRNLIKQKGLNKDPAEYFTKRFVHRFTLDHNQTKGSLTVEGLNVPLSKTEKFVKLCRNLQVFK